nr:MAG TPA: hypothetical protein [Caudoviricetes sp.]
MPAAIWLRNAKISPIAYISCCNVSSIAYIMQVITGGNIVNWRWSWTGNWRRHIADAEWELLCLSLPKASLICMKSSLTLP